MGQVNLRVLETPGHCPGSVVLYADGQLLAGDVLFQGSVGRWDLPGADYDTLAASKAPVIASHSSVDAVKDHPWNLSDDMLRALAKNGGVIHIDSVIKYIDPIERERTPISVFIDHIMHALKVAGPDHVGIGNDFGYDAPAPVEMKDVSKFEEVTYELLKRGVDEATIRKVWGENTLRVMTEVEQVALSGGKQPAAKSGQ